MNDFLGLIWALIAGMLLGIVFFAGLWWTVRRSVGSKYVALWFFTSMVLRMGVVVLGFYFILGDEWYRLIMGLLGFIIARLLVLRLTLASEQLSESTKESRHES